MHGFGGQGGACRQTTGRRRRVAMRAIPVTPTSARVPGSGTASGPAGGPPKLPESLRTAENNDDTPSKDTGAAMMAIRKFNGAMAGTKTSVLTVNPGRHVSVPQAYPIPW